MLNISRNSASATIYQRADTNAATASLNESASQVTLCDDGHNDSTQIRVSFEDVRRFLSAFLRNANPGSELFESLIASEDIVIYSPRLKVYTDLKHVINDNRFLKLHSKSNEGTENDSNSNLQGQVADTPVAPTGASNEDSNTGLPLSSVAIPNDSLQHTRRTALLSQLSFDSMSSLGEPITTPQTDGFRVFLSPAHREASSYHTTCEDNEQSHSSLKDINVNGFISNLKDKVKGAMSNISHEQHLSIIRMCPSLLISSRYISNF